MSSTLLCVFSVFLLSVHKNLLNCLQIAITVHIIGLQIAGFCPFIPAIHGDERSAVGMSVDEVACRTQGVGEVRRGVVARHGTFAETRAVVPADGDVDIVGNRELPVDTFPLLLDVLHDFRVIFVDVREVAELVVRRAGKA